MSRDRTHRRPDAGERAPQPEPAPPAHAVLALQRQLGNRAVGQLLARDKKQPTHLDIAPVDNLYGGTDADTWAADVRDDKNPHLVDLYSELATLLHATVITDVKGTGPKDINAALRPAAGELKPGLNLVSRGVDDRGQTGYLYDDRFEAKLPSGRNDPLPKGVTIVLSRHAFEARNKASSLAVLRHELEHAGHNQLALAWYKRWRDEGAAKASFPAWIAKQSMAEADRALVKERYDGSKVNTEALGHLEGYIAGFPVESPSVDEGAHPVYATELEVAGDEWIISDSAIREEMSARLGALKARLKGERLTTFKADLKRLKAHDSRLAKLVDPLL